MSILRMLDANPRFAEEGVPKYGALDGAKAKATFVQTVAGNLAEHAAQLRDGVVHAQVARDAAGRAARKPSGTRRPRSIDHT